MARKPIKIRAQREALGAANIDPEGLDPEMRETLSGEAARRVGAAGVRVEERRPNPINAGLDFIKGLFKKKKR